MAGIRAGRQAHRLCDEPRGGAGSRSASKADIEVLPRGQYYSYGDWSWWLCWSPDSNGFALPIQPSQELSNIAVVPADGSRPAIRVAPSGEYQDAADWSQDGGLLVFAANADGLRSVLGGASSANIQAVFASRKARDEFERKLRIPVSGDGSPIETVRATAAKEDKESAAGEGGKGRAASGHEAFGFEPDGVEDRFMKLSQQPASLVYFGMLSDGVSVLSVEEVLNPTGSGHTLTGTVRDLRQERRKTLFSGLAYEHDSAVRMSRDRKRLYFLAKEGGYDTVIEVDTAKGSWRSIRVSVDTTRDAAEARKAAFEQLWSLTKKKFYDPKLNGVDWDAARAKYERFLPSIRDARDLAELLSEMAESSRRPIRAPPIRAACRRRSRWHRSASIMTSAIAAPA